MDGNFAFLKGNIETIILSSLYSGDKYGYEITKEIKDKTEDKYEIKQATLYAYLKRLETQNLVESYWGAESNGGRRKYFKLSELGKNNCEKFMSEWNFQRNILENLVISPTDGVVIPTVTQKDATPLFGAKTRKERKLKEISLEEQYSISKQISNLSSVVASVTSEPNKTIDKPTISSKEISSANSLEINNQEKASNANSLEIKKEEKTSTQTSNYSNDIVYDKNAFIKNFEEKASKFSSTKNTFQDNAPEDNYRQVLRELVGTQLDDMSKSEECSSPINDKFTIDKPVALTDIAELFSSQGIRMRLHNRVTATYKPQIMLKRNLIDLMASLFAFLTLLVSFAITYAVTHTSVELAVFAGVIGCCSVVPLFFLLRYIINPEYKVKPTYNAKPTILISTVVYIVIAILIFSINILFNIIAFDNVYKVVTQIVLPLLILTSAYISVFIYTAIYKNQIN